MGRNLVFGVLLLATGWACDCASAPGDPVVRFGVVTDCHYADREPNLALDRHYRVAKEKLAACIGKMNELKPDFLIELGDFKDAGRDEAETLRFLDEIESVFAGFKGPRYHVLGNHDTDRISKDQFLEHVVNTGFAAAEAEYAFERRGVKFIVLDGNFNADGTPYDRGDFDWRVANVSAEGLAFLRREIASASGPVVVFCHQRLDVDDHYAPRNAADIRRILEASGGKVKAVFTGHHHAGGGSVVNGIPYYSIKAVIEGGDLTDNAFALVEMDGDGHAFVRHQVPIRGKIMSYNVRHCEGMDHKLDIVRTAARIVAANPEYACLQEIDKKTARVNGIDEPAELGRLTGLVPTFAKAIPFQDGEYGLLILSRATPLSVRKIPLPGTEPRLLLLCEFADRWVGTAHLSVANEQERLGSVDIIRREVAALSRSKPVFLTGDWNATPDSSVLKGLGRFLTVLSETNCQTFHGGQIMGPDGRPEDMSRFCIDYIAVDTAHAATFVATDASVVGDRLTSDHAPIVVTTVDGQGGVSVQGRTALGLPW